MMTTIRCSSDHPTLLVFTNREGCGPCKKLQPVLNTLLAQGPGDAARPWDIQQVDRAMHAMQHTYFNITYVPTFLVYLPGNTPRLYEARAINVLLQYIYTLYILSYIYIYIYMALGH